MYKALNWNYYLSFRRIMQPILELAKDHDLTQLIGKRPSIKLPPFKNVNEAYHPNLVGVSFEVEYLLDSSEDLPIGVLIRWTTPTGEERMADVGITYSRSNLGKGYVGYFLCPRTGAKCRKLFTDGLYVCSRHAFKHTYSYQNDSRIGRACSASARNGTERQEAIRKHRMWYRGKPTRWARLYERVLARERSSLLFIEDHICNFYKGITKKRKRAAN
ncbi:MAG: hypothetical protein HUJ90_00820 [Bacteroidales bacterium]|nr:hypothetical protein [Bacteroidales bacterium]